MDEWWTNINEISHLIYKFSYNNSNISLITYIEIGYGCHWWWGLERYLFGYNLALKRHLKKLSSNCMYSWAIVGGPIWVRLQVKGLNSGVKVAKGQQKLLQKTCILA
jgi:hypothetical protein